MTTNANIQTNLVGGGLSKLSFWRSLGRSFSWSREAKQSYQQFNSGRDGQQGTAPSACERSEACSGDSPLCQERGCGHSPAVSAKHGCHPLTISQRDDVFAPCGNKPNVWGNIASHNISQTFEQIWLALCSFLKNTKCSLTCRFGKTWLPSFYQFPARCKGVM